MRRWAARRRSNICKNLGVTAVELLPVHAHIDDKVLVDRGLTNYWGYNTIGFFAPHGEYSSSGQMRRTGHGIQSDGAQSSRRRHRSDSRCRLQPYRGRKSSRADALFSRHRQLSRITGCSPDNPRFYLDFTGTGNTFNTLHPRTLQLVMDSLRYWVTEMHVDGFRFDLAPALARDRERRKQISSLFSKSSSRIRFFRR